MRLRRSRLRQFSHCAAVTKKDKEGGTHTEYGPAVSFRAETWPAGGKLQAEMYGIRLSNIRNLRIDDKYREVPGVNGRVSYELENGPTITVNDGICMYSDSPDYKVVAIYPYSFLTLEVEKL